MKEARLKVALAVVYYIALGVCASPAALGLLAAGVAHREPEEQQ